MPAIATAIVAVSVIWAPSRNASAPADVLRAGVAQWNEPAWQRAATADLARQQVDFVLLEDGREIYRSVADPLANADLRDDQQHGPPWWSNQGGRLVQRLELPGAAPQRVAFIYGPPGGGAPGAVTPKRFWLLPLVGFSVLLATLSVIAWVLGRAVNAPLAATSAAARQIASGDLDVALPSSRVREVAEVNSAVSRHERGPARHARAPGRA